MTIRILILKQVKEITGLSSRSSIYLKMKDGSFPKSVSLGERAIGWSSLEIDNWVKDIIGNSADGGEL